MYWWDQIRRAGDSGGTSLDVTGVWLCCSSGRCATSTVARLACWRNRNRCRLTGAMTPLGRAGQPAELAPVYVLLASDEGSYISAARIAVTGGRPVL